MGFAPHHATAWLKQALPNQEVSADTATPIKYLTDSNLVMQSGGRRKLSQSTKYLVCCHAPKTLQKFGQLQKSGCVYCKPLSNFYSQSQDKQKKT